MSVTGIIIVFLFLSVLVFVGLYVLIASETESTTVTDRETAQRDAFEAGGTNTRRHAPSRTDSGGAKANSGGTQVDSGGIQSGADQKQDQFGDSSRERDW